MDVDDTIERVSQWVARHLCRGGEPFTDEELAAVWKELGEASADCVQRLRQQSR